MNAFRSYGLLFAALLAAIGFSLHFYMQVQPLTAYLAAVNTALFFIYGFDKAAARLSRCRSPELLLHLGALAGGLGGAFAAQRLFRHKVSKRRFMVWFWMIAVLQVGAVFLLYNRGIL